MVSGGEGASTLTFQAQQRPRGALTSQVTKEALENAKLVPSLEASDGKQRTMINLFPDQTLVARANATGPSSLAAYQINGSASNTTSSTNEKGVVL
jgi:hypothetical protein